MPSSKRSVEAIEHPRGVLELRIDTPCSAINVFGVGTAAELVEHLASVRPNRHRAVVLSSGKPTSFINGVGLMMANAVRGPGDVSRLTASVRKAYRALELCPVETVALVRGACFGCGVELSLRCNRRVTTDAADTRWFMTEIADYLFVPCFGATYELPRRVGIEAALDLLLWGELLDGRGARRVGLADMLVPDEMLDEEIGTVVGMALSSLPSRPPPPPRDIRRVKEVTERRIAELPAEIAPVYRSCAELLFGAVEPHADRDKLRGKELLAAGRSLISDASKRAQGFFYIRQMAALRARRLSSAEWLLRPELEGLPTLERELRAGRFRGVTFDAADPDAAPVRLRSPRSGSSDAHAVVIDHPEEARLALSRREAVLLMGPEGGPRRLVEVAVPPAGDLDRIGSVIDLLERLLLDPVVTRASKRLITDRLMQSLLDPLEGFVAEGGASEDAVSTLGAIGFTQRLWDALDARVAGSQALVEARSALGSERAGRPSRRLEAAVLLSMIGEATSALLSGDADHPSVVDVIAREMLDFPLSRGSLCRYVDRERIRELLEEETGSLVTGERLDVARRHAGATRDHYA